MLVFVEGLKPEYPEKTLGARTRTNNKLNPHMGSTTGIEPGPRWWETSALTTVPSLHPKIWIGWFSNRTGTSPEDARACGIVWTRVYFDYLMGILDARAVVNCRSRSVAKSAWYASRTTEKLVKSDHLCSTSFSVWCKLLTVFAVHYVITGHPLIRILTALRANLSDTCTSSKVELNPRVSDATPRTPRPSVPSHAPLMQSGVSRCAVIVVEGWSGDELIRKTAVFDTKWNVATTWSKAKEFSYFIRVATNDFAWL